jgi:hypothetical protein
MTEQQLISIKTNQNQYVAGNTASVFKLPIDASHVLGTAQKGSDLVIRLDDGRVITIKDYFKNGKNFHQLAFTNSTETSLDESAAKDENVDTVAGAQSDESNDDSIGWMLGLGAIAVGVSGILCAVRVTF